jgi:hypothetical protein
MSNDFRNGCGVIMLHREEVQILMKPHLLLTYHQNQQLTKVPQNQDYLRKKQDLFQVTNQMSNQETYRRHLLRFGIRPQETLFIFSKIVCEKIKTRQK